MTARFALASLLAALPLACTGSGPYSLGEDRAVASDAAAEVAAVPDATPDGGAASDGAADAGGSAIRCGERREPCAADEFCDFTDTACGASAAVGRCLPRPVASVCPIACNPVCGCDGRSYCNECFAHVGGVDRKLPCP